MNTAVNSKKNRWRTLSNLLCSIAEHGISAGLALIITPLIVRELGIELYGLYPIILEVSAFFGIAFGIVNSTSSRYISIACEQGNGDDASRCFSTAFFSNLAIGIIMVLPMLAAVFFAPMLLEVPAGAESDVRAFMCLVFASVVLDAVASAFGSVYYITNRLDVRSGQQLIAAAVKAALLGAGFAFFDASLAGVGAAVLASTAVGAVIQICVFSKMTSGIRLSIADFSFRTARRMTASGLWYSINRVASVMMCGALMVLANAFFDPLSSGLYSVAFVAVNALGGIISVLAAVFVPVSAKCFARGEQRRLRDSLVRDQKIVGYFAAVAVSVFAVFCDEFYALWLGETPDRLLVGISVLLIAPMLSLACATPIINVGMVINRTRRLALFFLCGGLMTVATALGVIFFTDLGIMGVALTSAVAQTVWYSLAVPLFAARVLKCSPNHFFAPILRCLLAAIVSSAICLALNYVCRIEGWWELFIAVGSAAAVAAVAAFFGVFKSVKIRI